MSNLVHRYHSLSQPLKAAFWFSVMSVLQKGISFITVPIFIRLLSIEEFGTFSIYQSWLSIISIFATLNLSAGVFNNGMIKYEDNRDGFTSSMQGLSTCLTILFFVLYLIFWRLFSKWLQLSFVLVVMMYTEILLCPALYLWSARQRFEFRYRAMVIVTLLFSFLNPIIGIILLKLSQRDRVETRVFSLVVLDVFICGVIYLVNAVKGRSFFNRQYWVYALKFNIPLIPHYLSSVVLINSNRILINALANSEKAGIYSLAQSLAMITLIINTSINSSFIPWTYQQLRDKNHNNIGRKSIYLSTFVAAIAFFMVAASPELVRIVSTKEYYEAIWIIPPVAISVYLMFLCGLFTNIEFYYEKNKYVMTASIYAAIMNIVLNYICISIFGYIAAGYTTLISYLLLTILHYFFMRKICKDSGESLNLYPIRKIIIITAIMFVACGIIMTLYNLPTLRYVLVAIAIVVVVIKRNVFIQAVKRM